MTDTLGQSVTKSHDPSTTPFTLWTVFQRTGLPAAGNGKQGAFEEVLAVLAERGIQLRGAYDVSAMRSNADLMLWLIGPEADGLQQAIRDLRRTDLLANTEISWSAMGVHREAEFAKNHVPSYMRAGLEPKQWVCVYPFVRSYEWYLLPDAERGAMLRDHGMLGRDFPQVLANTVSAFALGDWEWLLGLEADSVVDLVDLMRHLRSTDARMHVREEVPFYTGRRLEIAEIAEVLR
ncbi:hydrogen peroxide-dependent heme synthase [Psychromicrobium xiongbiense]|uniref:hydrogen peroxide-dependent heme synthase n=1 Tax=Psychromicrobium xiongbiense TaxID=3051184 RepID=UPI002557B4CA|nr:hydrogen peroxide-dependent heme synthase [Psychromicrobium sp. YIM S02556]